MKHDIIVRVLKALRIEKRPGSSANILVDPKLAYSELPVGPYTGLEIPHWQFIEDYIESFFNASKSSLLIAATEPAISWQTDLAPDETGALTGETYAERFGNTPVFQVWLNIGTDNYSLEVVPVTMQLSSGNISSVVIQTSDIPARIIIK